MSAPWFIIPCSAAKADQPAPAARLYQGQQFKMALAAARAETDDAHILILSARHGLLALDQVVAPYDTKMGDPGSVTVDQVHAQLAPLGIVWESDVYAFLPRAYYRVLDEACRIEFIYPADVYEACGGIGEQRKTCSIVARPHAQEIAA